MSSVQRTGEERRALLDRARLYLIIEATVAGEPASSVVEQAVLGGVDLVQLRDKDATDAALLSAAGDLRAICARHGALLIVNDRPDLAAEAGADGVHVGQDDVAVEEARGLVGPHAVVGLSTHSPEQIDAAGQVDVDYVGVGPVYPTATKPGPAAVGEQLVTYAAAHAAVPFFAIGGIDVERAPHVVAAGATRLAVVRAIRDSRDPYAAARALRALLMAEGSRVGTH